MTSTVRSYGLQMAGAKAVRSVQKRGSKRTRVGRTVLYWMVRFERIVVLAPRSRARRIPVSDLGTFGVYHNQYHNLGLLAQPLACKLLIRKTRGDVRLVEGARLESVSLSAPTVPTSSPRCAYRVFTTNASQLAWSEVF